MSLNSAPCTLPVRNAAEIVATEVLRHRSGQPIELCSDRVAAEEPLEIRVRGRSVAVTMRTPGHDDELAAGFLLGEGLIRERRDVTLIAHSRGTAGPQNIVNVFVAPAIKLNLAELTRHVFASSSCGLC